MNFLKELHGISTQSAMVDLVCKAIKSLKLSGIPYQAAIKTIAPEFRKLDKRNFSSNMSDEALDKLIKSIYHQDDHLSDYHSVTSYRDSHFSPMGAGPGADEKTATPLSRARTTNKGNAIPKVKGVNEDEVGSGSLDNQQQEPMISKTTPPDADDKTPDIRTIAKTQKFRVDLGKNEQVSIIDINGHIRLSMPYVEWQQLTRQ